MNTVNKITKRQFDAYCYARQPVMRMMSHELDWYEACNRKLLGIVIIDEVDNDYGYIVLGRDLRNLFRCMCVGDFKPKQAEATSDLIKKLEEFARDGKENYPQGDETKPPQDLMKLVVSEEKIHPYFKFLKEEPRFEAARNLIREAVFSYIDIDGNYIEQFQTNGFDARLWEIFLYIFFYNSGFELNRNFHAPDFVLNKYGFDLFVEAVIVGENKEFDEIYPETETDIINLSHDYMPIKFGSPLYSKLQKKYWEQDHVKNKPFALAIHDFHQQAEKGHPSSMCWSRTSLADYLYGVRSVISKKETDHICFKYENINGIDRPVMEKIEKHKFKNKEIPSGFFKLNDSENISAVIFSNGATITTFNRMGKLAGLGSHNVKMMRIGSRYNNNGILPNYFYEDVDDKNYEENWEDTIVMYHNPFAKHPIPLDVMPNISHIWFDYDNNQYDGYINENTVLSSITHSIEVKE